MKIRERVARAIFDVGSLEGVTLPWEKVDQGKRDFHLELADAAIKAMSEPDLRWLSAVRDANRAAREGHKGQK